MHPFVPNCVRANKRRILVDWGYLKTVLSTDYEQKFYFEYDSFVG